jgi:hypothetical protein
MTDYFHNLLADMLENGKALMRCVITMAHKGRANC